MKNRIILMALMVGCSPIEASLYRGLSCDQVSEQTCEDFRVDPDDAFKRQKMCTSCDDAYEWELGEEEMRTDIAKTGGDPELLLGIESERVVRLAVETEDGAMLDSYFVPAREGSPLDYITVIYNHDSYGNIEYYISRLRLFHSIGVNVFIWDYRGYGKSEPSNFPSARELRQDARDVVAHLKTSVELPDEEVEVEGETTTQPHQFLIYGMGLGASPAIELADRTPNCGLILEVPMPAVSSLVGSAIGGSLEGTGGFRHHETLTEFEGALLVLRAEKDEVYPKDDVADLYGSASTTNKKMVDFDSPHELLVELDFPKYQESLEEFLVRRSSCVFR